MNLDLKATEFKIIIIWYLKIPLDSFLKWFSGLILFLLSPGELDELKV